MGLPTKSCDVCGESFWQGRGRPSRYCPPCRAEVSRYGSAHQAVRAATIEGAVGTPCARCKVPIMEGQQVHLDHRDGGNGYLGFSHARCNVSAGASRGNSMRAAIYRAVRAGLSGEELAKVVASVTVAEGPPPPPPKLGADGQVLTPPGEVGHQCDPYGCHPGEPGSPCLCGSHSCVW